MIEDTLKALEQRIRSAGKPGDEQADLLALVAELRTEFSALAETHEDDAASLAEHTREAAEGAEGAGEGAEGAGAVIEDSAREFEARHPKFVGLVRSLLQTLGDAGI